MPTATILFRPGLAYRRELFAQGLARLGYQIDPKWQRRPQPGDVVVLWNRMRSFEAIARRYADQGARVIVAENGYLPVAGGKQFALALEHHQGLGRTPQNLEPRLAWECQPWRESGSEIVILAQRGIGELGVAMPNRWPSRTAEKVRAMTSRPVRVRPHPGARDMPLEPDLTDAWAVITWASGAGIKAMVAGVPCFHALGGWIGEASSTPIARLRMFLECPYRGPREPMLARVSWAQWGEAEIGSGDAFARVLACA